MMALGLGLRHLSRLREILSVLVIDFGFGHILDQLGVAGQLPGVRRRRPARRVEEAPDPRRLRLALAELGPTFIKLGQMLSARGDILSQPVVAELRRLQDEGPEVPFSEVRGVIERELGRPVEQCYASSNPKPLSAASLGQVHAAVLPDGREVTVKVLRPGVRRQVEIDLQVLGDIAVLLHRRVPSLRSHDLPSFVRQFSTQMQDEMSYRIEAYNADRLRVRLEEAEINVRIPHVVWDLTTKEVLTTERVYGHRADRGLALPPDIDNIAVASQIGRAVLHQIFVCGFFHGDPHHGNMLVGEDGAIVLLDFGIMGYFDPRTRRLVADAVRHVYEEDIDGLTTALCELGVVGGDANMQSLRNELARIVSRFMLLPRREFPLGEVLMQTLRALWLNSVRVPAELSLAAKALLYGESVATDVDPDFDFRDLTQPILRDARARSLAPGALADRLARGVEDAASRLYRMPIHLERVLSLMQQGGLQVRVEDVQVETRWGRIGRVLNRVGLSLLSASLLVSGTMFMVQGEHATHIWLGTTALCLGFACGLIVVVRSLRPGQL
ncbi:MAG: hypothetical protein GTN69_08555 [Armatimonadetes bacterium]|nr:hypothetical protein [Gemmatimonadales bacterium]NIO75914.1 hypothetical protein [Armatimonadota bacterium]